MFKFPYGISDFYQVRTQNYFYIDRTEHIRTIEEYGRNLLFLRPRRFGKSLLVSKLENYYDIHKANEFETLFAELAIGQQPTSLHNQYLILRWDFSLVDPQGTLDQIKESLYDHINTQLFIFMKNYEEILGHHTLLHPDDALASFQQVLGIVRHSSNKIYLLIDEYDNFANEVLMSNMPRSRERYEALVQGEGVLKTVFKVIKGAMGALGLDRVFMTGVSPVLMSDLTSGHNISENITFLPELHDVCGFQEAEIMSVLQQIQKICHFPADEIDNALIILRSFYNGYRFHPDEEKLLYNPTLAIYFFKHLQRYCTAPRNMLDGNFAMDRAKIAYVAGLPNGAPLIEQVVEEKEAIALYQLEDRFGIAEMLSDDQDNNFFASLLYYLGVLTLGGTDIQGRLILNIPNLVVRKLYVQHLQKSLLPGPERNTARQAADRFYSTGDIEPLCRFVEQRYLKILDNRDYKGADELTIKTAFLTLLFNDTAYIMDSEKPLERGYADLTMIVRPQMRKYQLFDILIEFKYLKLGEVAMSGDQIKSMSHQEVAQLQQVQEKLTEATAQAKKYRQRLLNKYGTLLRLRTYVIVAIGFDRVVWREV